MKFISKVNNRLNKFNKIMSPIITVMCTFLSVYFLWKIDQYGLLENILVTYVFISEGLLLIHYKINDNHSNKR